MRQRQRAGAAQIVRQRQTDRYAISLWIPSTQIIAFAHTNGITV